MIDTEKVMHELKDALEKVHDLERELQRRVNTGAQATDRYVRDNPWRSVGIAAAAAFLLGALVSHRD